LRELRVRVEVGGSWRRVQRGRIRLPAGTRVVPVRASGVHRNGARRLATVVVGS
jgi:hypothetical protein